MSFWMEDPWERKICSRILGKGLDLDVEDFTGYAISKAGRYPLELSFSC